MTARWSECGRPGWYRTMIAVAALACGCHPAGREVANHTAAPAATGVTAIERAHAYERGTGVPRDYRAAAELYRAACNDGRGDTAACGALIRAGLHSRGADFDKVALQAFASKLCVDRRDAFSCAVADLLSPSERDIPEPVMAVIEDVLEVLPECDAGHRDACETRLLLSALDFSDSSAAQARRAEFRRQLCSLGFVESCKDILLQARYRDHTNEALDEEDAAARKQLAAACDAGDAEACVASPDRKPIPAKELCAANDYEACGAAGCRGDAQAAKLAASHGVEGGDDCARLIRAYEQDDSP